MTCPCSTAGTCPPPEGVNIVQVTGASLSATNSCLAQEATWAGSGLNLYIFLTFGTSSVLVRCLQRQRQRLLLLRIPGRSVRLRPGPSRRGRHRRQLVARRRADHRYRTARLVLEPPSRTTSSSKAPTTAWPPPARATWASTPAPGVDGHRSPATGPSTIPTGWPRGPPADPTVAAPWPGGSRRQRGFPPWRVPMVQWTDNVFNVSTGAVDGDYVC